MCTSSTSVLPIWPPLHLQGHEKTWHFTKHLHSVHHFSSPSHSHTDLYVLGLLHCQSEATSKLEEQHLIYRSASLSPNGINIPHLFCCYLLLSHFGFSISQIYLSCLQHCFNLPIVHLKNKIFHCTLQPLGPNKEFNNFSFLNLSVCVTTGQFYSKITYL